MSQQISVLAFCIDYQNILIIITYQSPTIPYDSSLKIISIKYHFTTCILYRSVYRNHAVVIQKWKKKSNFHQTEFKMHMSFLVAIGTLLVKCNCGFLRTLNSSNSDIYGNYQCIWPPCFSNYAECVCVGVQYIEYTNVLYELKSCLSVRMTFFDAFSSVIFNSMKTELYKWTL